MSAESTRSPLLLWPGHTKAGSSRRPAVLVFTIFIKPKKQKATVQFLSLGVRRSAALFAHAAAPRNIQATRGKGLKKEKKDFLVNLHRATITARAGGGQAVPG